MMAVAFADDTRACCDDRRRPTTSPATLTTKQRAVLEVIGAYQRATGEPCSASLLARRLRVHHSTIQGHLSALHRKGWLLTPNAPASLR
jgi:Mn-dependent DtxR family transcriptional regulator